MQDVEKGEQRDIRNDGDAPPGYGSPANTTAQQAPPSYDQYQSSDTALAAGIDYIVYAFSIKSVNFFSSEWRTYCNREFCKH